MRKRIRRQLRRFSAEKLLNLAKVIVALAEIVLRILRM